MATHPSTYRLLHPTLRVPAPSHLRGHRPFRLIPHMPSLLHPSRCRLLHPTSHVPTRLHPSPCCCLHPLPHTSGMLFPCRHCRPLLHLRLGVVLCNLLRLRALQWLETVLTRLLSRSQVCFRSSTEMLMNAHCIYSFSTDLLISGSGTRHPCHCWDW